MVGHCHFIEKHKVAVLSAMSFLCPGYFAIIYLKSK